MSRIKSDGLSVSAVIVMSEAIDERVDRQLPRACYAIDRTRGSDYDQRMSMPPVLTEAASPRSRTNKSEKKAIAPSKILETIEQHVLLDGFKVVVDLERSRGSYLHNAVDDRRLIDLYGFFG